MATMKKWFGLAALAAIVVAFLKRKKEDERGDSVEGSIET
jgi:hypothetical protein